MPKERVRLATSKASVQPQYPLQKPHQQHQHHHPYDAVAATDDVMTSEGTDSDNERRMLSDAASADLANENRTNLIVNYLPQSMCQEDLKTLFSSVGQLDSCKLIRDKATGHSLGYGFVKYKSSDVAQKAIHSLNGLRIQNKTLKVSLARPSCDNIKGANLYVGGLPKNMTNQDLISLFSPCGQIITARVLSDPNTGLTKGVGFIRFNLKSEAETAIKMRSGTVPPGATEPITVKFANQPSISKVVGTPNGTVPQLVGTVPGAATLVPTPASPLSTSIRLSPFDHLLPTAPCASMLAAHQLPLQPAPLVASSPPTLCVSNLPPDVDDAVVCRLFQTFGVVQSVHVVRDPATNKSKGVALVAMSGYDEALNAIHRLSGQPFGDCRLQVNLVGGGGGASAGGVPSPIVPTLLPAQTPHGLVMPHGLVAVTADGLSAYPGHMTGGYSLIQLPIM